MKNKKKTKKKLKIVTVSFTIENYYILNYSVKFTVFNFFIMKLEIFHKRVSIKSAFLSVIFLAMNMVRLFFLFFGVWFAYPAPVLGLGIDSFTFVYLITFSCF